MEILGLQATSASLFCSSMNQYPCGRCYKDTHLGVFLKGGLLEGLGFKAVKKQRWEEREMVGMQHPKDFITSLCCSRDLSSLHCNGRFGSLKFRWNRDSQGSGLMVFNEQKWKRKGVFCMREPEGDARVEKSYRGGNRRRPEESGVRFGQTRIRDSGGEGVKGSQQLAGGHSDSNTGERDTGRDLEHPERVRSRERYDRREAINETIDEARDFGGGIRWDDRNEVESGVQRAYHNTRNFGEGRSNWRDRSDDLEKDRRREGDRRGGERRMLQSSEDGVGRRRNFRQGEYKINKETKGAGMELEGHVNLITSVGNAYVKHLVKMRQSGSYRNASGCVVIVGSVPLREICEAISRQGSGAHKPLKVLLAVEGMTVPSDLEAWSDRLVFVSEPVMRKVAGVDSAQGLQGVGVLALPSSFCNLEATRNSSFEWVSYPRRLLVLDAIQDPGNLGTLLRTAAAFAWDGVFLLPGCCDPFNEKALRASRGASFRVPIASGHWTQLQSYAIFHRMKLYAADPVQETNTKTTDKDVEFDTPEFVSIYNENSSEVSSIDDNIKSSVMVASHSESVCSSDVFNPTTGTIQEAAKDVEVPGSVETNSIAIAAEEDALCLVLGSEGQGLSEIVRRSCARVSILMPGESESLNVAVAGGILLCFLKNKVPHHQV